MIEFERKYQVLLMEAGYVYLGMKRFKEAKQIFEGLAIIASDSEVPVIAQGGVAFCEGDLKKAVTLYKKALKIDPESGFAKVYLGEALLFSGKVKQGTELLTEVAELDAAGAAGEFAKTLLDALKDGFEPKLHVEGKKDGQKDSSVH